MTEREEKRRQKYEDSMKQYEQWQEASKAHWSHWRAWGTCFGDTLMLVSDKIGL